VAGVTIGTVAALAGRAGLAGQAGEPWLRLGVVAPVGYTALILAASLVTGRGLPPASLVRLPLVYATMHGSWGVGFLASPRDLRA
jgi:hypothetical protein